MHIPLVRSTGRRLKRKHLPAIALFSFLFLLFLFLTPAEYVNCQHIYPDECLDFFGICEDVTEEVNLNVRPLNLDSSAFPTFHAANWYASHVSGHIPCRLLEESFQSHFTEILLITVVRC
jgi:hypothetical protein